MRLPNSFKESMRQLLGDEYDSFIKSFDEKCKSGIRVNTSKISVPEFEQKAPFPIEKIPFIDNGYYIRDTDAWSKHPYYYAGLYYIQEPSAMLSAATLPLDDECVVLDLCAAPGGKSTGICTRPYAALVSNDISYSRTIPLVKNLELFGCDNALVTCESPSKLAALYPGCFDRIVVDAPCSGEGMFRKDADIVRSYEKKGPALYKDIQRQILESAYTLLSGGGYILYSTCTYSDIEDELIVLSLLEDHDDLSVCEIDKNYGLTGPYTMYAKDKRIKGCVHALPHLFCGEGHFMALIKKDGQRRVDTRCEDDCFLDYKDLPDAVIQFAAGFEEGFLGKFMRSSFLIGSNGQIFMMSDRLRSLYNPAIRYSRTGTCIGSVGKGGRFIPHTALALYIRPDEYRFRQSFAADDPMVIKYLKGETLIIPTDIDAGLLVLICVEDHPLGFAYYDGSKFKNLYEKGWVYR